jgi:hypothetical protein
MVQVGVRDALELVGERARLFRREVQSKGFYGDEPVLRGFVGPENGTKGACADLMQNSEGSERRWRCEPGEIALTQR